jgi:hypothetical protein
MIYTIEQEKREQLLAEKYWSGVIAGTAMGMIVMFLICL